MARQKTTTQRTFAPPEALRSAFLSHYFFMDAVLGHFMTDEEKYDAYLDMAEIFCLANDPELEDLYSIMQNDLFAQTDNYDNFCYLSRTMQLMPWEFSQEEQYIMAQKSNGFAYFRETFKNGFFTTKNAALFGLEQVAKHGNTYATALLAFFSYTGICLPLGEGRALHRAKKLGLWNDLFGLLLQLHYADVTADKHTPEETQATMSKCLSMLYASLDNDSEGEMLTYIVSYYGFDLATLDDEEEDQPHHRPTITPHPLAAALERRLGSQILPANVMNDTLLKVLRSPILSDHAKQCIISSFREGERLDALPLYIRRVTQLSPITRLTVDSPLARPEENRQILANLSTIDARAAGAYRPLLLVCRDPYVAEEYMRILQEVFTLHATPTAVSECIDLSVNTNLSLLTGNDKTMVNLLNKLKDACPVLFFKNCQALNEQAAELLVTFLQPQHRRHFPTAYDNVTLDLSGILPIMFATSAPDKSLSRVCDVIHLKDVSVEEMPAVLSQMLQNKCQVYHLASLDMDEAAKDHLQTLSPAEASALLDKAIAHSRLSHADICQEPHCHHGAHIEIHLTGDLLQEAEKLHIHPGITRFI